MKKVKLTTGETITVKAIKKELLTGSGRKNSECEANLVRIGKKYGVSANDIYHSLED